MPDPTFAMHIPEGLLSSEVALLCAVLAAAAVAWLCDWPARSSTTSGSRCSGWSRRSSSPVQMLNFPVADGTSGHLLGATLAAVLLGPWLAYLVLAVVLVVQALLFADGGIVALGPTSSTWACSGPCSLAS